MSAIDDGSDARESPAESDSGEVAAGLGGGILGNLPNSRPSVRSPRRAAAPPEPVEAKRGDVSHKGGEPADFPRAAPSPDPAQRRPASSSEHPAAEPSSEIEALARGGIAVAEAVATTGLRLAGRAAARLRDAIEPR